MQTRIAPEYAEMPGIDSADAILRSCVHCGFCNATCPTYLELGDERDGPRGRIYLIKQLLEGYEVTTRTQTHFARCLTCLNCQTTCPSGVQYGRLLDFGRNLIERQVRRPLRQRLARWLLMLIVPHRRRFGTFLFVGRLLRPMLPAALRAKVPPRRRSFPAQRNHVGKPVRPGPDSTENSGLTASSRSVSAGGTNGFSIPRAAMAAQRTDGTPPRRVLALDGCVQAAATPATNEAAMRVLARLGIALDSAPGAGCCGALAFHLGNHRAAMGYARRNVDAWWPAIEAGAEAIAITASGCGPMVRDYGEILAGDPAYAAKAARVAALTRDISEILRAEDLSTLHPDAPAMKVAFHCPCTLQHGQKLGGVVEGLLTAAGFDLAPTADPHLCCGSAGAYSLLEPEMSKSLLRKKLAALTVDRPNLVATANVGCQLHLETASEVPVKHWIELIDDATGGVS